MPWPGAPAISVSFSSYVPMIWIADALNVILEVSRWTTIEIFRGNGNSPIGKELMYTFGSVTLNLIPDVGLTWRAWGLALSTFTTIFNQFVYTGFTFTVIVAHSLAGSGFLYGRPTASATATPQTTPQAA